MPSGTGIIVFGHSRPKPLANLLESLRRQDALQKVSVWLDGDHGRPAWREQVAECRRVAEAFPEATLVAHNGHLGIEKLMLDGLTVMAREFERIVVLEDDCFPAARAVRAFEEGLEAVEEREEVYSVYGHHFLVPAEGETITRFQGWGWATTARKLQGILEQLKACFMMPEAKYLRWVQERLTAEVRRRLEVTPGRDVTKVMSSFFSWDSCTALLTAMKGMAHKRTPRRVIYNCGMGPDSGHFALNQRFREPPFNMIGPDEVWDWYEA